MTNIIKTSIFTATIAIAFGALFFVPGIVNIVDNSVFAPASALAIAGGGEDGGCCGGDEGNDPDPGGYGGNDPDPTPDPTPKCNYLRVNGGSSTVVPYGGGNVTLSWSASDTTSITMSSGYNGSNPNSSAVVYVSANTNFALRPYNGNVYGAQCSASVTVAPQVVASCDSLTADKVTLPYGGGTVKLTWNTTNAKAVYLTSNGKVSEDGVSFPVQVTGTMTFFIEAVSPDNSIKSCSVTITVLPQTSSTPDISIVKRDSTDKDDEQTVSIGGTANFEIIVTNTGAEDLKDVTITDVLAPNCNKTIGNLAIGQSHTYTCTDIDVQSNYTNTAAVTGKSVVDDQIVTDSDPSNVSVTTNSTLSCDSFKASDTSVRENARVTLTWNTTGVSSVSIDNGVGTNLPADGSTDVVVGRDTTYTLTLTDGTTSKTCKVAIDTESGSGGGGGSKSPKCTLKVSDKKVNAGDEITLTWDTTRATDIVIKDDHGNTLFDIDDYSNSQQKKYYDGEIDVVVTKDTKFTLTAKKGSKRRACSVSVDVDKDDVLVITEREQEYVVGIELTQVPYTGFEAGPALTYAFYTLLTLWAMFVAYVLVVKESSILGFSLKTTTDVAQDIATDEYKKKVARLAAKYSHQPIDRW